MKGHYIEALVASLCELGVDRPRLLAEAGLEEADLSSDVFVHHDRLESITLLAARYGKGTGVGLRTGQRLNINSHGALGYAAMASKNLEHAVQLLLKYYRVQAPRARFSLRRDQDRHFLVCDPSFIAPGAPWLTAEMLVTSIYTSVDFLLSGRNHGLEVWFSHEMPPHGSDYPRVFAVPVSFSQRFNGLVIPDALAHLPLLFADALASTIFEKRCEAIRQDSRAGNLADSIRDLQSQGRFLSQNEVGKRLHMSVSTLHRKMAEERIDYKALVADIKKERAIEHLREGVLTVEEIALVLGFSDASNFRRAFMGWTGQTPREVREREGREPQLPT